MKSPKSSYTSPSSCSLFLLFAIFISCHISKNQVHSFTVQNFNRPWSPYSRSADHYNNKKNDGCRHSHPSSSISQPLHLFPELSSATNSIAISSSQSAATSFPSLISLVEEPFLTLANSYSTALQEQPFITKACTGFFLCGSGDVLAQLRVKNQMFDMGRLLRFASKGFFGTLLWAEWYDLSDVLIQEETIASALQSMGMVPSNNDWSVPLARTVALILAEQFITCPLIYGIWEIPVSTVLNGASPSKIPKEVKSKMIPMLIDNAKLWTWANLIIYNVPLSYRAICGNVMDILWQSIVSDYAADCGRDEERVETDALESNVNMNYDSNKVSSSSSSSSSRVLFQSMSFKK